MSESENPGPSFDALRRLSDEDLAREPAAGDDGAASVLLERFEEPLHRYTVALVRDPDLAREATWSALFEAARAVRANEHSEPLRPWLFRIAHKSADVAGGRPDAAAPSGAVDVPRAAAGEASEYERLQELLARVDALPASQRSALVLRELVGMEYAGIATVLGARPAAARQAVFNARLALGGNLPPRTEHCDEIRGAMSKAEAGIRERRSIALHLETCPVCTDFAEGLESRPDDLRTLFPPPREPLVAELLPPLPPPPSAPRARPAERERERERRRRPVLVPILLLLLLVGGAIAAALALDDSGGDENGRAAATSDRGDRAEQRDETGAQRDEPRDTGERSADERTAAGRGRDGDRDDRGDDQERGRDGGERAGAAGAGGGTDGDEGEGDGGGGSSGGDAGPGGGGSDPGGSGDGGPGGGGPDEPGAGGSEGGGSGDDGSGDDADGGDGDSGGTDTSGEGGSGGDATRGTECRDEAAASPAASGYSGPGGATQSSIERCRETARSGEGGGGLANTGVDVMAFVAAGLWLLALGLGLRVITAIRE